MSSPELSLRSAPSRRARVAAALALAAAFAVAGCYREPTRWDQVQQETQGQKNITKGSIAGSEFNKFFPKSDDTYSVVYTQEKAGFAQADVKKDGEAIATISVFDTSSNPEAAAEFQGTADTLDGYPLVDKGEKGNAVLVADRIQVQVRSKDANVDKSQRLEWLKKVDLANLAQMAKTH